MFQLLVRLKSTLSNLNLLLDKGLYLFIYFHNIQPISKAIIYRRIMGQIIQLGKNHHHLWLDLHIELDPLLAHLLEASWFSQ